MASFNSVDRPVFIVSAPRSGSTLLFETLANAEAFWTIGGEGHLIVEGIPKLTISPDGVESNRLTAADADPLTAQQIRVRFMEKLVNRDGSPRSASQNGPLRMLEKTPKNSLRIPFFQSIYPDAMFVYLYRDPRENLSSIMEAWRAGGWITYQQLPEWDGPWSLLLPPGYDELRGKSLAQIAAFQWMSANRHILDDLGAIPGNRWIAVGYDEFVNDPETQVRRICQFADVAVDPYLEKIIISGKLPLSRYTLTPPSRDKWRVNAEAIGTVLPDVLPLYERILQIALTSDQAADIIRRAAQMPPKISRNDPCPCGSAKRYKYCHGVLA